MNRKIPKKNYFFVIGISIITICLVVYIAEWYKTTIEYQKNNSVLSQVLLEIKVDELESYLLDNPQVVIYTASAKDETIKNFEKKFKKLIEEEEITEGILYLDTSKEENDNFNNIIKKISENKLEEIPIPNLIYFEGNEVISIMYKNNTDITRRDVYNFLIRNGIIGND